MKGHWLIFLFLIFSCGQIGCQGVASQELIVFAASSLTDAFNELGRAFEANREGVRVLFNYGGSSQLATQLNEGGVADLFASANGEQMVAVINGGRVAPGRDLLFLSNHLTIIVPADNPANIQTLEHLGQPNIQLILAVGGVPIRQYTDQMVAVMPPQFQEQFYANLVSEEENVRQIVAKVALGEADAGIVYNSDVTPDVSGRVQQIAIPATQNIIATYPIAPLANAPHPELAQQFIDFVLSPEGQTILRKWGFGPPPAN